MEGDINAYVADYKRELLQALVRNQVTDWAQVERGIAAIASDFLPNPNRFAEDCKGRNEITGSWGTAAHRVFAPDRLLVDKTTQEQQRAVALDAVSGLRTMFDESRDTGASHE